MKHHLLLIVLAALCAVASANGQSIRTLGYNTTNGQVVYGGTNTLTFTNTALNAGDFNFNAGLLSAYGVTFDFEERQIEDTNVGNVISWSSGITLDFGLPINFGTNVAATRTNLSLGGTWLTNTNVENFRTAIAAAKLHPNGNGVAEAAFGLWDYGAGLYAMQFNNGQVFFGGSSTISNFRTSLEIGVTNTPAFGGIISGGNIVITNQSAATNGLLFVYRTNNEPFLGLANLIASNNTTISNETLFRVGTAEATNRSAQFGFRSTNTNGSGVAVFSVFGYNALMMIGADSSTNAVVYSGGGTNNEVMTLIKNGATEFARPIAFSSTAHAAATRTNLALGVTSDPTFRDVSVRDLSIVGGSGGKIVYPATNTAPANTTNVAAWIQVNVGTNSYRVPLYQ